MGTGVSGTQQSKPRMGAAGFSHPGCEVRGQGGDPRLRAPPGGGRLWAVRAAGVQARAGAWRSRVRLGRGGSDRDAENKLGGDPKFGSSYDGRKAPRSRLGGAEQGGFSQLGSTTPTTHRAMVPLSGGKLEVWVMVGGGE